MARYTLIQSGDFNAAENIGALAGDTQREGIVSGLNFSAFAPSVPEIDVAAGKTAHIIDSQTAEATADDGTTITEQRDQVRLICHVDAQTVGLTDAAVNELYLTPQPDIDDSPAVVATTSGDPTTDALKIGEVDTNANTVSEQWNLITEDGTLSYPDADAANSELQSLPTGVSVINRATGTRITDGGVSVSSVEAVDSFTGPGGNTSTRRVGLPTGAVIMFSGSTSDIPDGYTLCDGTDPRSGSSSVPDLRNRFIAGAGDEYTVGATGGEKEHQLTLGELPSHSHSVTEPDTQKFDNDSFTGGGRGLIPDRSGATTGSAGNDEAHENRPRFFSLAFIFKL